MPELYELSVAESASRIATGEISPVDLAASLLDRIGLLEPGLKTWVYLDREAVLTEARKKADEVKPGAVLGPLHGVPIGLKDIYYTAGIPTTACSRLYADFIPEYDATTVTFMKNAGAIMLGKTVTTEFATFTPRGTRNPFDREMPGDMCTSARAHAREVPLPTHLENASRHGARVRLNEVPG